MNILDKDSVIGISALLVHAAKIDEIYSDHEKNLVKDFIKSFSCSEYISSIFAVCTNSAEIPMTLSLFNLFIYLIFKARSLLNGFSFLSNFINFSFFFLSP